MIELHRLKGKAFYLNHHLIETIESGMDTVLVLTNGHKYIVEETVEDILQKIREAEGAGKVVVIEKKSEENP